MATVDHYAVLELPQTATTNDIRAAYKRLVILRHPDKNLGNPWATADFQKLQGAYETLSNLSTRQPYDATYRPSNARRSWQEDARPKPGPCNYSTHTPPDTAKIRELQRRMDDARQLLQQLCLQKGIAETEKTKAGTKLLDMIINLKEKSREVSDDDRKAAAKAGWFDWIYGLPEEQEEGRTRDATARKVGLRVLQGLLERQKKEMEKIYHRVDDLDQRISEVNRQFFATERELIQARETERTRVAQEARAKRMEAQREKERQERAARAAREAKEQQDQRERQRRAQEAQRMREEAAQRERDRAARVTREAQKEWDLREAQREAQRAIHREQQRQARVTRDAEVRRNEEQAARAAEALNRREAQRETQRAAHRERQRQAQTKTEAEARRKQEEATRAAEPQPANNINQAHGHKEARRRARKEGMPPSQNRQSKCRHQKFWNKVEGSNICACCSRRQVRYAFRCPGCDILACAECRVALKRDAAM